jgi:hypothetical protein
MSRMRIGFLVLLCVTFVGAAIGLRGQAQAPPDPQGSNERIISGADLGFRVEGRDRNGGVTGTLMVRINGQWIRVGGGGTVPLTSR